MPVQSLELPPRKLSDTSLPALSGRTNTAAITRSSRGFVLAGTLIGLAHLAAGVCMDATGDEGTDLP